MQQEGRNQPRISLSHDQDKEQCENQCWRKEQDDEAFFILWRNTKLIHNDKFSGYHGPLFKEILQ